MWAAYPNLAGVFIHLLRGWWITHPRFKVQALEHRSSTVHLAVTLFRTGQVRMLKTNLVPRRAVTVKPHWLSINNGGTWSDDGGMLVLNTHQGKICYEQLGLDKYIRVSSDRSPNTFDHLNLESVRS